MKLKIATRTSQLAMWQSEFIKAKLEGFHKGLCVELEGFKTKGDLIQDRPLSQIGGKGLFTKELEQSMLRGDANLAVHSLKDVPSIFPEGLTLAAVYKREDVSDALLSHHFDGLAALPQGAVVGTTSLRRKMQLLMLRPDLNIKSLRGNVNTRLAKLEAGEFDAIVLAYAGLKRLGLEKSVKYLYKFSLDEMIPASSQGALGVESLDEPKIKALLACLNDPDTALATSHERAFIHELEGGCSVPIGVHAKIEGEKLHLRAIVGMSDASEVIKEELVVDKNDPDAGVQLAKIMIKKGAKELLAKAEEHG